MPHALAERLSREFDSIKVKRANWEAAWRSVATFVLPGNDFTPISSRSALRSRGVYDETAIDANIQLGAAQFSLLTNPASKWFLLTSGDEEIDRDHEARLWLDDARDRMLAAMARERSGFYANVYQSYLDEGALGTSPMFIGRLPEGGPRYFTVPLSETYLRDDDQGRTEAVFRDTPMTWRQIDTKFGEFARAIPDFAKFLTDKPDEFTSVLHVVEPRRKRDPNMIGARNMPFASVYMHVDTRTILGEGGFRTFPYNIFFWQKRPGETYGRSPGMNVIRTIRLVNEMWRTTLKSMQKMTDPPIFAPHDSFMAPMRLMPGSINYYRQGSPTSSPREIVQALTTGGRPDLAVQLIETQREAIRKAFHMNLLVMREGDRMTATEVNQRVQEMRMLSPFVARTQQTLDGIIRRTYDIMLEDGMFLQPPPALSGVLLHVEYASPLTRAQRLGDIEKFLDLTQTFAPLAALMPEEVKAVMQNLNLDEAFRDIAVALDYPESALRDPAEVQARRDEQMQLAQLQAQAAIGKDVGAGLRDATQAAQNLGATAPPTGGV